MKFLDNKVLLITGGTGSFGSAATKILLKTKIKKLIIFSRDENKQYQMQNEIKDKRLRFFIGDITFKSFKEGVVTVELKGSCSGCPSSIMTLKQGVQNLLCHYIPEIKEVIAV